MVRIGISYYPDFYSNDECDAYLSKAQALGYNVVFTSLILNDYGFENTSEYITDRMKYFLACAKKRGFEVRADITKFFFEKYDSDIKYFKNLGIDVLRLDGGFSDLEVAKLTNEYLIEDNLSNYYHLEDRISLVNEVGNIDNYTMCHNFFPKNDTGLSLEWCVNVAKLAKENSIKSSVFISSMTSPNDLNNQGHGVPSIEDFRYMPASMQLQILLLEGVFTTVIFGDSYVSEQELKSVSKVYNDYSSGLVLIPVYLDDFSGKEALLTTTFSNRSDIADYIIRGTQTRGKIDVSKDNILMRQLGTISVDNSRTVRYAGEMQIALRSLPADSTTNVVGCVKPYAIPLLKYIKDPKIKFSLIID